MLERVFQLEVNDTSIPDRFKLPGEDGYVLGTDQLGRDQLLRLIYGGRVSLTIAYLASVMTVTIGVTLGLLAGYYGKAVDDLISWGVNTLSAIPPLFLLADRGSCVGAFDRSAGGDAGGAGLGGHEPTRARRGAVVERAGLCGGGAGARARATCAY